MFKKRKLTLFLTSAVVLLLVTFSSCRQKKDDAPPPIDIPEPIDTTPVPVNDNYLITKISIAGVAEDSLVYANERIVEQWATSSKGTKRTNKYFYDSDGRLATATYKYPDNAIIRDSLVWSANEVITYTRFMRDNVVENYDTTLFKIDGFNRIIRYNTTDTVGTAPTRSVSFWEGSFTGNNLTTSHWVHYWENYPNESSDIRITVEYGRLRNPLAKYLIGNPWLSIELLNNIGPSVFSEFNMTKIKDKNGQVTTTATATRFPDTENILTQTIKEGNNTKTVTYGYIPKP